MRRHYLALALALVFFSNAVVLHAQGTAWQELRTLHFSILYPDGAKATAEQYAQFVDGIYDETSVFWGFRPDPPIVLRIYPTMDLYYQANPLAAQIPGVVAHAQTGRREISIAIPQTSGESDEEIRNNVRHELTHIIAADLSGGRLTTFWQEGIAQYAEHPSPQLEQKMALMRQVVTADRLLSWAQLNQSGVIYSNPQVGYPESLTVVAFLIHRDGIARFRAFVEAMKDASDYRGALQSAYGAPADELEREWQDQLPGFIGGGYRSPGAASSGQGSVDLDEPERLLAQGDYAGALARLRPTLGVLQANGDAASLSRAQGLVARAETGQRATQLAADARNALVHGDYQTAGEAARASQKQLTALGQTPQAATAGEYAALAARGMDAEDQLVDASGLLRRLQIRAAQQELVAAYKTFGELGDEARAAQARQALELVARGEHILAITCLASGGLLVLWSSRRRYKERHTALPFT